LEPNALDSFCSFFFFKVVASRYSSSLIAYWVLILYCIVLYSLNSVYKAYEIFLFWLFVHFFFYSSSSIKAPKFAIVLSCYSIYLHTDLLSYSSKEILSLLFLILPTIVSLMVCLTMEVLEIFLNFSSICSISNPNPEIIHLFYFTFSTYSI